MSVETESGTLRRIRNQLPRRQPPSFHIERRPDGIIVVRFDDFSRSVVDQWVAHVKASDGRLRSPLRMLYDFREAGPPSAYALSIAGPLMEQLTIPEDTCSAYVFAKRLDKHFTRSILRCLPPKVGRIRAFSNFDSAIAWLRESLAAVNREEKKDE
ncbi:MAG: hypothetical protein GYB66_05590 [Chloroflexi bacterium]|nr:hypothetical protein [Chloroflexota bacterium]